MAVVFSFFEEGEEVVSDLLEVFSFKKKKKKKKKI